MAAFIQHSRPAIGWNSRRKSGALTDTPQYQGLTPSLINARGHLQQFGVPL